MGWTPGSGLSRGSLSAACVPCCCGIGAESHLIPLLDRLPLVMLGALSIRLEVLPAAAEGWATGP